MITQLIQPAAAPIAREEGIDPSRRVERFGGPSLREWHIPGYNWVGAGTAVAERMSLTYTGSVGTDSYWLPVNKLDFYAWKHDMLYYADSEVVKLIADVNLVAAGVTSNNKTTAALINTQIAALASLRGLRVMASAVIGNVAFRAAAYKFWELFRRLGIDRRFASSIIGEAWVRRIGSRPGTLNILPGRVLARAGAAAGAAAAGAVGVAVTGAARAAESAASRAGSAASSAYSALRGETVVVEMYFDTEGWDVAPEPFRDTAEQLGDTVTETVVAAGVTVVDAIADAIGIPEAERKVIPPQRGPRGQGELSAERAAEQRATVDQKIVTNQLFVTALRKHEGTLAALTRKYIDMKNHDTATALATSAKIGAERDKIHQLFIDRGESDIKAATTAGRPYSEAEMKAIRDMGNAEFDRILARDDISINTRLIERATERMVEPRALIAKFDAGGSKTKQATRDSRQAIVNTEEQNILGYTNAIAEARRILEGAAAEAKVEVKARPDDMPQLEDDEPASPPPEPQPRPSPSPRPSPTPTGGDAREEKANEPEEKKQPDGDEPQLAYPVDDQARTKSPYSIGSIMEAVSLGALIYYFNNPVRSAYELATFIYSTFTGRTAYAAVEAALKPLVDAYTHYLSLVGRFEADERFTLFSGREGPLAGAAFLVVYGAYVKYVAAMDRKYGSRTTIPPLNREKLGDAPGPGAADEPSAAPAATTAAALPTGITLEPITLPTGIRPDNQAAIREVVDPPRVVTERSIIDWNMFEQHLRNTALGNGDTNPLIRNNQMAAALYYAGTPFDAIFEDQMDYPDVLEPRGAKFARQRPAITRDEVRRKAREDEMDTPVAQLAFLGRFNRGGPDGDIGNGFMNIYQGYEETSKWQPQYQTPPDAYDGSGTYHFQPTMPQGILDSDFHRNPLWYSTP